MGLSPAYGPDSPNQSAHFAAGVRIGRTTRVLGFSVPPPVVKEVESLAKEERRTKSEPFRETIGVYQKYRLQRDREELR